jgi:hypothetical protein
MPSLPRVHRLFDNSGGITVPQRAMDMARSKPQALSEPREATRAVEKRLGLGLAPIARNKCRTGHSRE